MADKVVLSIGTKRGLFLLESNKRRSKWEVKGPFLKGWTVHHALVDTRGKPKIHAAAANFTYASSVFSADVSGRNFKGAEAPPVAPKLNDTQAEFANKYGIESSQRVWIVEPGPAKEKNVLYAGTAPAGLFRSEDNGKSWQGVSSLNEHETRGNWNPGAGGMSLHSIQVDPFDPQRMYVAISAAGAFRSDDSGASWKPINSAVAEYVGAPEESMVGT